MNPAEVQQFAKTVENDAERVIAGKREPQLDRFLPKLSVGYPSPADESQIMLLLQREHSTTGIDQISFDPSNTAAKSANLSIAPDDGNESTANVTLGGNGEDNDAIA